MKRLVIVGAGGFGREVAEWARDHPCNGTEWVVSGFLDAQPQALTGTAESSSILGDPTAYLPSDDDLFVCALGLPRTKETVVSRLKAKGARFITLVHPTAIVGRSSELGEGCVVCPRAVLTVDIVLGEFVLVNLGATVGHDARVGSWSTLSAHVDITGRVEIGRGVLAGSHASVIPGIKVGDGAVLGAGSVVVRNVRAGKTVFGAPAREI